MPMKMTFILFFVVFASSAAFLRYNLSSYLQSPYGIILVNSIGCLLIGTAFALKENQIIDQTQWVLISVAFLGAFTTFSSYILDIFKFIQLKSYSSLISYVFVSHIIALSFSVLGYKLGLKLIFKN